MNVQEQNQITMQIGKKGINDETIKNIKQNLAKNKLVKLKFLKNTLETTNRKEITNQIIQKLEAMKTEHKLIGNTLFLKRIKN